MSQRAHSLLPTLRQELKMKFNFNFAFKACFAIFLLFSASILSADSEPVIQDNSFLIEEAYNQEFGVVQHINTFMRLFGSKDWIYTFTQEWPLPADPRHQLSYTLALTRCGAFSREGAGIGDALLNYRYQLVGNGETRFAF